MLTLVRRHPIAVALAILVLVTAIGPLPPLVDAATGSPAGDGALVRPLLYVFLAPLSDVLDALTFLSVERAEALLLTWSVVLALWWGLRSRGWRRIAGAVAGPVVVVAFAAATVALPRPVPRLTVSDSSLAVVDYHAHTQASHDGRKGWTASDLAQWHARQGFTGSYVTDHNSIFMGGVPGTFNLLQGVEWSVFDQHVIALGPVQPIDRSQFDHSTAAMLRIFAELHRQGAVGIASLPEYWRNHFDELDQFIGAGVDGFEIVTCAPKALGFPAGARHDVLELAQRHDLLVIGASDNHGWGAVTCVWNVTSPGPKGFRTNHVLARPLALLQDGPAESAGVTQFWFMLRGLSWAERASWLTWILVIAIYLGLPRRRGQRAGVGILARSLSLKTEPPPVQPGGGVVERRRSSAGHTPPAE
ncbi:MAG TPA: hypothetical protein VFK78_08905 [Gemmatimonadales bacterium]|nr:hypothetical protein [Gemmatimonadales bacterium]